MDQAQMREIALNQAVRFGSNPNAVASTTQIVGTAEAFFKFLNGESETK